MLFDRGGGEFFQKLQHDGIEFVRVLFCDEMASFYKDQFRLGYVFGYKSGVFLLHKIFRACDDKRWSFDLRQIGHFNVRIVDHQAQHFRIGLRLWILVCKESCYPIAQFDRQLKRSLNSFRIQISSIQDEFVYLFGIKDGKYHGNVGSIGKPEDMGLLNRKSLHKSEKIVSKLSDGEGFLASWRLSMPACVYRIDVEVLGEERNLFGKIATILPVAMEKD